MFEDVVIFELAKIAVNNEADKDGEDNEKKSAAVQHVRECIMELSRKNRMADTVAMQTSIIEEAVEKAWSIQKVCEYVPEEPKDDGETEGASTSTRSRTAPRTGRHK